jgi:GNAT superfamily N-acetyltransferase
VATLDLRPLDNPIWNALGTEHRTLALTNGPARRYPSEIGPLSGIPDQSPASFEALRGLAAPGGVLVLFFEEPSRHPANWTLLRGCLLNQMIRLEPIPPEPRLTDPQAEIRRLTFADVPAMIKLADLTEPGPFRSRTIELGGFFGAFHSGRLVAMSGQRLHLPHFIEVSAVCTHPDARGRGYARRLMSLVIADIVAERKTPILHVLPENRSAISVYESLGFTLRRQLHLAVLKRND